MKGRPNNLNKTVVRSKSPIIVPNRDEQGQPRFTEKNGPSSQTDLNRVSSAEGKIRRPDKEQSLAIKRTESKLAGVKQSAPKTNDLANRQLRIEKNGKANKDEDSDTTQQSSSQHISYVAGEYQLNSYEMFARRKNVKFEEKVEELDEKGKPRGSSNSSRNSSILKNGTRVLDRSIAASSDRSISIQNSFTAVKKCKIGFTSLQENSSNNLTRKKYESILEHLKARSKDVEMRERYTDDLFPPVQASIFSNSVLKKNNLIRGKEEIVWQRVTELYPGKQLRVYSKEEKSNNVVSRGQRSYAEPFMPVCMNSIRNNTELLGQIFENDEINPYGIYLVKIYQDSFWRYVIIDDLIPCIKRKHRSKKEQRYQPAFISVLPSQEESTINIWPFLLEKAYANYYSCYENLCVGNALDFMSEITGAPYYELLISKKAHKATVQKNLSQLQTGLLKEGAVVLGWSEEKNFCSLWKAAQNYTNQNIVLAYYQSQTQSDVAKLQLSQLSSVFTTIYLFPYGFYTNSTTCPVYPPKYIKERFKRKEKEERVKQIEIPPNDTTSLRTFTIFKKTNVCLDIRQKQNRFYYQCGINQYLWVRGILMQKEYDGGFRWVAGRYSNQKHIIFEEKLEPGEYYLVIMVEWRERHNKELTVVLYSECDFLKFERKNYSRQEKILEFGCMDLAQRYGKLNQINKSICAYTYLCEDSALIIENINNERTKGEVTIMRSINGLKSKVEILPINQDFEVDLPGDYGAIEKQESRKVIGQSVEIDIQKGQSFTVVLRMRGGVDRKFFKAFNFG